jgi:hypothetical protein
VDEVLIGNCRMNQTMERLQKKKPDEYSTFIRVMFGLTSPSPVPIDLDSAGAVEWIDPSLNDSQKDAIKFALASREVALIHGPPGVSFDLYLHHFLNFTNCSEPDRENPYPDRAHIANAQAEPQGSSMRALKYIR